MVITRVCLLKLIPTVKCSFLLFTQVWSLLQQPVRDSALTDTYAERKIAFGGHWNHGGVNEGSDGSSYWVVYSLSLCNEAATGANSLILVWLYQLGYSQKLPIRSQNILLTKTLQCLLKSVSKRGVWTWSKWRNS
jgi:hypothetical protein